MPRPFSRLQGLRRHVGPAAEFEDQTSRPGTCSSTRGPIPVVARLVLWTRWPVDCKPASSPGIRITKVPPLRRGSFVRSTAGEREPSHQHLQSETCATDHRPRGRLIERRPARDHGIRVTTAVTGMPEDLDLDLSTGPISIGSTNRRDSSWR